MKRRIHKHNVIIKLKIKQQYVEFPHRYEHHKGGRTRRQREEHTESVHQEDLGEHMGNACEETGTQMRVGSEYASVSPQYANIQQYKYNEGSMQNVQNER